MLQTITTALSALLGAFIGAYFTRQSQHHKWLLERRAETFAKFLELLSDSRMKAIDILNSDESSEGRGSLLVEAYLPALNYARIVKLYLPKGFREEFYDIVRKYSVLHTTSSLGDQRLRKMYKHSERIQQIFEDELSAYFWLSPFFRNLRALTIKFK